MEMKNLKNTEKALIVGLVIAIFIVVGYSLTEYYDFTPEKESKQVISRRNEELMAKKRLVSEIDANLSKQIEQLNLEIINFSSKEEKTQISNEISFQMEVKKGQIKVPTYSRHPKTINQVEEELNQAIKEAGGTIFRSILVESEEKVEKMLFYGFKNDYHEMVVSHQYTLIKEMPRARLSFVIDDLGYSWPEFDRMMTIPRPMTFAVLPHLPNSTKHATRVLEEEYDLILHQPMEPISDYNPGKGAIYSGMTEEEINQILDKNLASLPEGIIGVNNHMGSKATADSQVMKSVLKYFKEKDMFFVDSRTSPRSVVKEVAQQVGEKYAVNYLFLDNVDEQEVIEEQIMKAGKLALKNGSVIAIGHVKNYTAKAILASIDELEEMGVQIIGVRKLIFSKS